MIVTVICQLLSFRCKFHLIVNAAYCGAKGYSVGLRETKARKTRKRISSEALWLFQSGRPRSKPRWKRSRKPLKSVLDLYRYSLPSKDLILSTLTPVTDDLCGGSVSPGMP